MSIFFLKATYVQGNFYASRFYKLRSVDLRHYSSVVSTCISIFLVFCNFQTNAQSPEYTIESFQGPGYVGLSSYQSIAILTEGDPLWEYEFQLEFPFPFFDSSYTWMFYEQDAWGSFTDDQDDALLIMNNFNSYTYDNVWDTTNITSDVRFSHVHTGEMQAFVIQYTENTFFADPFTGIHDPRMNFQLWFYENGVIELHFGEFNMDNSPIYAPGKGFYCFTTSGGLDTTEVCGPHMGISHPLDEKNQIGLEGAYNDFEVVDDRYGRLTVLPPEGWVIRFKPTTVSTVDHAREYEYMTISPNPTSAYIRLPRSDDRVVIYNGTGIVVYDGYPRQDKIDVSTLQSGIYYVHIFSEGNIRTGKFLRQ